MYPGCAMKDLLSGSKEAETVPLAGDSRTRGHQYDMAANNAECQNEYQVTQVIVALVYLWEPKLMWEKGIEQ